MSTDTETREPEVIILAECAEVLEQMADRKARPSFSHKIPAPRQLYLGHWRRFCGRWWKETAKWLAWGWALDLHRFLHRGRYGWAPHDSFEMSDYLNGVIGGLLIELAEEECGAPNGYPDGIVTNFDLWYADLARWGNVFLAEARGLDIDDFGGDYSALFAAENEQSEAAKRALAEMAPWWGAFWS